MCSNCRRGKEPSGFFFGCDFTMNGIWCKYVENEWNLYGKMMKMTNGFFRKP